MGTKPSDRRELSAFRVRSFVGTASANAAQIGSDYVVGTAATEAGTPLVARWWAHAEGKPDTDHDQEWRRRRRLRSALPSATTMEELSVLDSAESSEPTT